jgi:Flp pilus assembly pilin Flp
MITPSDRRADPDVPAPAWITWPVRILAVLVVVPVRLLWETLGAVGSFLARSVFGPCGRFLRTVVWQPLTRLLRTVIVRPIAWLCHYLVVAPATWLWSLRHRIGRFLHRYVARPLAVLVRLIAVPARAVLTYLLIVPLVRLARMLVRLIGTLSPVWRLIGGALDAAWRGVGAAVAAAWRGAGRALRIVGRGLGVLGRAGHRWLLRPAGAAIGLAWTHTAVPTGRWLRISVLQPASATARGVLVAPGLRR